MRIERVLNMTPHEFYQAMRESMAEQINAQLGKNLTAEDIRTGYTHKTRDASRPDGPATRFTVRKAVPDQELVIVHHSPNARSITSYLLKEDPKGCSMIYEQRTDYLNEKMQPKKGRLFISDLLRTGKINRELTGLEIRVQKNRDKQKKEEAKKQK